MLYKYLFSAMTTPCELQLYHNSKTEADSIGSLILREVKRLEKKYNFYSNNSVVAKINDRKSSKVEIDDETKAILLKVLHYSKKVNFLFDISIGTLKECYKKKRTKAVKKCLKTLAPFVGKDSFIISNSTLCFSNPFTKLDMGGVIKEYSVDKSLLILKETKIKSALINYGGDIFALGIKPDGNPWKIGIKNPKNPSENLLSVELENKALTTSAHYERNVKIENTTYSHIISPGQKQNNPILQATVISDSALQSGIYSTSLLLDTRLADAIQHILIDKNLNVLCNYNRVRYPLQSR